MTIGGDDMDAIVELILEVLFGSGALDDAIDAPTLLENKVSNYRTRNVIHTVVIIFRLALVVALFVGLCELFNGHIKFGLICTLVPITYFVIYIIVHYINKRRG